MIYFLMACICALLGFLSDILKNIETNDLEYNSPAIYILKKYHIVVFIMAFFPLFYIGAIRYFVGIDFTTYTNYQIPHVLMGDKAVRVEFLYKQVIYFGNWLSQGKSYQPIFVITQGIIIFFIAYAIKNMSKDTGLSIWVYICSAFYAFCLSGMRQAIAISIFLYALKYIELKRYKTYLLCILIATLFHSSAILYFGLLILIFININLEYVVCSVPVVFFLSGSIRKLLIYISNLTGFYSGYFNGQFDAGTYRPIQVIYVILVSILVISILRVTHYKYDDKLMNFMISVQGILTFVCGLVTVIPTSARTIFAFLPIHIILVPNIIGLIKNRGLRLWIKFFVYIMYVGIFYRCIIIGNYYNTLPYQTIYANLNSFFN